MSAILSVQNLTQQFPSGDKLLTVLHSVSFDIEQGSTCAIVGPSGSGKTTLLGLCAGLDRAASGTITLAGQDLTALDEDGRAALRSQQVGFVFQNFQLIPTLTALENVLVPLELRGKSDAARAKELLARVGLENRMHHYPTQLSGGEQQRVSLARAFGNKPAVLFADEPTGNLDEETGASVEALLFELNEQEGSTLILVTHDLELAKKTQRVLQLKGGHIVADYDPRTVQPTAHTETTAA